MSDNAENDDRPASPYPAAPYATREDVARLTGTVVSAVGDVQRAARDLDGSARETRAALDQMQVLGREIVTMVQDLRLEFASEVAGIKERLEGLEEVTGVKERVRERGSRPDLPKGTRRARKKR